MAWALQNSLFAVIRLDKKELIRRRPQKIGFTRGPTLKLNHVRCSGALCRRFSSGGYTCKHFVLAIKVRTG